MSPIIKKYYQNWIGSTTLLSHPSDIEKFYTFVKAILKYSRKPKNGHWLCFFLEKDLPQKYQDKKYSRQQIQKISSLFDCLIDFHNAKFPNYLE